MLTAWNWVAFQGSSVFGSDVIPMTRLPPGAPVAPVVADDVGVPEQPATRASAATPAVTPTAKRGFRRGVGPEVRTGRGRGDGRGDMGALLGAVSLVQKVPRSPSHCNFVAVGG